MPPNPTSRRFILLLSSHLSLVLPSGLRFPHHNPVYTSPLPHMCYMPRPSHSCRFDHPNNNRWVQIIKLLVMYSSPLPCYVALLQTQIPPPAPYSRTQSMFLPQCSIPWLQCALNFFVNGILICMGCSRISELFLSHRIYYLFLCCY